MFQDQEILQDLHSLPAPAQAEVLDFIRFLKQKQQMSIPTPLERQAKLALAAELLLQTPTDLAPEEQLLWDQLAQSSDLPVHMNEPDLPSDCV
jgi:hypothetical protein